MRIFGHVLLDADSFKAISHPVRIDILKRLDEHQATVSDIARMLRISKSTAHGHLERLVQVDLIVKVEEDRKWVYYRLTRKGQKLLHPENVRVSLALSLALPLGGAALILLAIYLVWSPVPTVDGGTLGTLTLIGMLAGMTLLLTGGRHWMRRHPRL